MGLGIIVVVGIAFLRIRVDELPWRHAGVATDAAYLSEVTSVCSEPCANGI